MLVQEVVTIPLYLNIAHRLALRPLSPALFPVSTTDMPVGSDPRIMAAQNLVTRRPNGSHTAQDAAVQACTMRPAVGGAPHPVRSNGAPRHTFKQVAGRQPPAGAYCPDTYGPHSCAASGQLEQGGRPCRVASGSLELGQPANLPGGDRCN
jgi:hypothetical protein